MTDQERRFVNPTGYWDYEGDFTVELTSQANKTIAPSTVRFDGNVGHIAGGRIKQTMGGIQLHDASHTPFFWGYDFIVCFRKPDGSLIWRNTNH